MSPRAFSLLEIVVAIFLVALSMALLLQVFPLAHQYRRDADRVAQSALLAQELMEELLIEEPERWPGPEPRACPAPWTMWTYQVDRSVNQERKLIEHVRVAVYYHDRSLYRLETMVQR